MEQFNYCLVVGQTDVGKKRAANEDNMGNAVTQNGLVSVVCDGMGGHVGGATASRIAVNAILENLKEKYYEDPRIAIGESIDIANQAILAEASSRPELSGMGSTCVLLIVRNGKVYIGHVGDSRIYLIRSKRIIQLTKDHSYVQMLVDRGEITKEQAERHPRKNEITNALGIQNMSPATIADDAIIPEAGDSFLLCSDGLSGMVPDSVINKVVSKQNELSAQARIDSLISIANENGGIDNITAQMVEFTITPGSIKPAKKIPLFLKILIPVVVLAAAGLGAYFLLNGKLNVGGNNGNEDNTSCYSAVDTTNVQIPETVIFKANTELVAIIFNESSLIFKRNENQVFSETNISFNSDSLKVDSPNIDIVLRGETRVLKFTENYPGENVIIEIPSNEPRKVYRFYIPISMELKSNPIQLPNIKKSGEESTPNKSTADKPDTKPDAKPDTIKIDLGEYTLADNEKFIFNYSVPYMKTSTRPDIPDVKEKLKVELDEVNNDEVEFDGNIWSKEFNPKNTTLSFIYKGKQKDGPVKCKFSVPCFQKNSTTKVVVIITLTIVDGNDAGEKEPADKDQAPKDSMPGLMSA